MIRSHPHRCHLFCFFLVDFFGLLGLDVLFILGHHSTTNAALNLCPLSVW